MTVFFKPTGTLDLSTDPTSLPSEADGRNESSGAMQRCKNLRLDENGVAKTRDGLTLLDSGLSGTPHNIVEQAGNRYEFTGSRIYQDGTSIANTLSNRKWSAILYNSYNSTTENIFALNGVNRKRIEGTSVYEWGIEPPTDIPTLLAYSGTSLTGDYNVRYTFCRKESTTLVSESNPSTAATAVTLASNDLLIKIDMTWDDIDTQVTHMRFYRTLTDGSLYYYDFEVALPSVNGTDYAYSSSYEEEDEYISGTGFNFATNKKGNKYGTYTWEPTYSTADDEDNLAQITSEFDYLLLVSQQLDASLGTEVATNHNRPPLGTFVSGPNYNGNCFIIKDNLLYYCLAKQPEYWPATYFLEMDAPQFPGKAGCFWNGQFYYFTKMDIFLVQGTGANTFFPLKMSAVTGTQGPACIAPVSGTGIYHVGIDGIYLFNNNIDKKVSAEFLEKIFRGESVNDVPGVDRNKLVDSWLVFFQGKLWFGYAGVNDTYQQNIMVLDFVSSKMWYFDFGVEIGAITVDETNNRLIGIDGSGNVYVLNDIYNTTDNDSVVSWEMETKDFTLQTRKHFPRWVKYDIDASDSACTATGEVKVNGTTLQSHSITGNRQTRRRLITTGNGDRVSIKVSGTGPVSIHAIEFE